MTREYPGNPAALDAIRSEIGKTTGAIPQPIECTCGRRPLIVSIRTDIVCCACHCGFRGPNARTALRAVHNWDQAVTERILEHAR